LISNLVTTVDTVHIDISLMSILRFFDPFSYCLHLIFHFLVFFWSHQDPILNSIPTQRRSTWSPVKKLERSHLNIALITVVVCKLYQWKELFPMILLVHNVNMQHILQYLVCYFSLLVFLWVICDTKFKLGSQDLLETSPKSSCAHRSSIRYNPLRNAMQPHNLTDENYIYAMFLIRHAHRNKMITLRQSFDYHKIELCLLAVSANPTMKSIEMTSHFDSRIVCGCSNPTRYVHPSPADIINNAL